ncbi:flgN protein [bacterium BMS3Abin03]|nr:flgN protein [bacterium BMS3Abin03]
MENIKLLELLKHQDENLEALLKTVLHKQKAIVSNDITEIESTTSEEEKLLLAVNQAEKLRAELLNDFYKKNSVKSNSFKLDDYLLIVGEQLDIQQRAEILNLQRKIKETTKEIIKVNQQNKYIIIQARTLLNEIVSAIFSERNNSLLDRKV